MADAARAIRAEERAMMDRIGRLLGRTTEASLRLRLKDAALRIGGFSWGMFFRAQPDTDGKLAAFAYAFEHLEIGGYAQLEYVAERARDAGTAEVAGRILVEERARSRALSTRGIDGRWWTRARVRVRRADEPSRGGSR